LFGIGYEKASADVLHVKRRKTVWNPVVIESISRERTVMVICIMIPVVISIAPDIHALETCVIDFDAAGTEIGDIEITDSLDVGSCAAFVDCCG
jgi:hypothetical protein